MNAKDVRSRESDWFTEQDLADWREAVRDRNDNKRLLRVVRIPSFIDPEKETAIFQYTETYGFAGDDTTVERIEIVTSGSNTTGLIVTDDR